VAATETGLDPVKLKSDYETTAPRLFQLELELSRKLGVRGFPTLFFVDGVNNQQQVYGFAPYTSFEAAVLKLHATAHKTKYDTTWAGLFGKFETLSTREFSELAGLPKKESETLLQKLAAEGKLSQLNYRNGVMWTSRKKNP
jgi:thioredoxin-related protein